MKKNTQDLSKRFGEKGRAGINGQDGSGKNGASQTEQSHGFLFQAKQMKTPLSSIHPMR